MSAFSQYVRLSDAVDEYVTRIGSAPKSVACGTSTKRALNAELIELMDIPNPDGDTVIQQIDMGEGPMDLYADLRLPADAMELRDEPCGEGCC